ncbi:MAG: hypothetical protein ABI305_11570, partial [Tepidiformaceae bacterium]
AKAFVDGDQPAADASTNAAELLGRLPSMAELAKTVPEERRPDLMRVLSEARLDLSYVQSAGKLPSSLRLGRYLREKAASADSA